MVKWIDIKGFEGRYQMSEEQEVKRLPYSVIQKAANGKEYTRNFNEKTIKRGIDKEGYYYYNLDGDKYRLHWLYFNTFIGDSTGYYIDHIDRNKLNNDPSNLRLLTPQESLYNRTLAYKPDIQKDKKCISKPYELRFCDNGKRKTIGHFSTYEEAENKYRELYNERQKRIDANSKISNACS